MSLFKLLVVLCLCGQVTQAFGYSWTQSTRWREDSTSQDDQRVIYPESNFPSKGYDVRPHQQLRSMFPSAIVGDGNNKETSDNLWEAMLASEYVIGNSSDLPRARDMVEDYQINFIDPTVNSDNFFFTYYSDNSTRDLSRFFIPLTLSGGPHDGESIINNNNLLAVGDNNTLWLDPDGSISIYNYDFGGVDENPTNTTFSSGPASWIGQTIQSKISLLIGYEAGKLYFLEGDNSIHIFDEDMDYVRTDEFEFEGSLYGYNLSDLVDGNITNAYYIGWDNGPIVVFVRPDYGGYPPVHNNTYTWTHTARWREEYRDDSGPISYRQESGSVWDVRPHRQTYSMFPDQIVGDGDNKETSDNLWKALITSDYIIGDDSTLPRANDFIEDWDYNFIDPADTNENFWGNYYTNRPTGDVYTYWYPLTMQDGEHAGESVFNNDKLLAMGDNDYLWLDADGTLSRYDYSGGDIAYDFSDSHFQEGPRGWLGAPLADKLQYLIGYENNQLYFLVGDDELHVFDTSLDFVKTQQIRLNGDLSAYSLGDIVDKQVSGVTYVGWDLGPIFVMVDTSEVSGPDHFRLSYASSALTCNPHEVTITACADAACSSNYADTVNVTLSPTGWVGGDSISFSGGTSTVSLAHTQVETVSLGVVTSTPEKTGTDNLCQIDGGAASTHCSLSFADSGFIFSVSDTLANKEVSNVAVRAVSTDDTNQCVPAFADTNKNIDFWSDYITPDNSSRVASLPVYVNSRAAGSNSGSPLSESLYFDSNGEAQIAVRYPDAGQVQLNARYTGSGDDDGLVMQGSDQFVSRPAGLCVSTTTSCSAADSSCPAFAAAGDAFQLSIQAMAWEADADTNFCDNTQATPSYDASSVALSANLLAPAGGVNGTLSPSSYHHSAAVQGKNDLSATQSEVGVFSFSATPPAYLGGYLGNQVSQPSYTSAAVGRFYPHHFDASVSEAGALSAGCTGASHFLYSGDSTHLFPYPEIEIQAKNASGVITQNYTETGFNRLSASQVFAGISQPTQDNQTNGVNGTRLAVTANATAGTLSVTANGVLNYQFHSLDTVRYQHSANAEVASFTPDISWSVGLVEDSDSVAFSSVTSLTPSVSFDLRFGRIWVEEAYGSEMRDLAVPIRAEYYNGSQYVLNQDDSCTDWDTANASVTPSSLTELGVASGRLAGGESGQDGIVLRAPINVPGTPDTGKARVIYTAPAWLQGDYDGDGSFENPEATANFGIYRGHDRIIYRRESVSP